MRSIARPFSLLLCASLLLAPAGCRTSFEEAEDVRAELQVGMTRDEVRKAVGDPAVILPGTEGGTETWSYLCTGGPNTAAAIVMVILALPLLPLILLMGGVLRGGLESNEPPYFVTVRFDAAGRVKSISLPGASATP